MLLPSRVSEGSSWWDVAFHKISCQHVEVAVGRSKRGKWSAATDGL